MTIAKLFLQNQCAADYAIFNGMVNIDLDVLAQDEMCNNCTKDPPFNCPIWDLDESELLEGGA